MLTHSSDECVTIICGSLARTYCAFKELSTGGYLLVFTDDYTRYRAVEPRLNKIFAEFGIPGVLRSDNGQPFNGKDFAHTLGSNSRKVNLLLPRADGEVERFMHTVKKTIEAEKVDHRPRKEELCDLLHNYRATPPHIDRHTTSNRTDRCAQNYHKYPPPPPHKPETHRSETKMTPQRER